LSQRKRKQYRELVATDSREGIGVAHAVPQQSPDSFEQVIAGHVAKPVVHLLEVVQINKTPAEIGAEALWMVIRKVYLAAIERIFLVRPSLHLR
jgi:hypothetical protein